MIVPDAVRTGTHLPTLAANFLSFFTIESDLLSVIILAIGAIWGWTNGRRQTREPGWFAVLLVCVSTYMTVTGILYNLP